MRRTASARWKHRAPKKLMERLEALAKAQAAAGAMPHQGAVASHARVLRWYFALGFAASGVMGCLALLVLVVAKPGDTPAAQSGAEMVARPQLGALTVVPKAEFAAAVLDFPIRSHERANAPFYLRIAGVAAELAAQSGLSVRLRQMPKTAWLSKGQRQDEHTWALRTSDLEGLRLTMGDGTPDVFDVVIEVLSEGGAMATQGVARVRVLEEPARVAAVTVNDGQKVTTPIAPTVDLPLRVAPARKQPVAPKQSASRTLAGRPIFVEAPAPLPANPPVRPEGLSALGGPASASDNRQIWWQLPTPAWAPFSNATGGN